MLELKGVKKTYYTKSGPVNAINGLDLTFPSHGMVFVIGKSGCGKTTLLNVIGGLDGIDEGEICVLGKSFKDFTATDYDAYRNTFIGFIFQEYNLLPDFTVEKNIKLAMEIQGEVANEEELDNLLKTVEIEGLKNRKPSELSGGQRQRVAIARALLKNPRIIMADEPTGALDAKTGAQVFDILKKLSKEKLVIVVSHDLESAEKYADRIIRLVDGNVVEDSVYSDTEIETNLKEEEQSLVIREGADLTEPEKNVVASAIKNKKKIEVIEKLSYREKSPTGEVESIKPEEPVKLKKSKMKFKSSLALGMKSLTVKPLRLAFTIFLAVVAFAVFGLFDTLATFNTEKGIKNMLKTFDSDTISISAEYLQYGVDKGYAFKFSDGLVQKIEQETGYEAKGVISLTDNTGGVDANLRPCLANVTYPISNLHGNAISDGYYSANVNGFLEFSREELGNGAFGFSVLDEYGSYPGSVIKDNGKVNNETVLHCAITPYLAESIMYYLGDKELECERYPKNTGPVNSFHDLINKEIKINGLNFIIKGIVDCGQIPEKFNSLKKTNPINMDSTQKMLSSEFQSFIGSGAYQCVFVGKGFSQALNMGYIDAILAKDYQALRKDANQANVFYAGNYAWGVTAEQIGYENITGARYVYAARMHDDDNVALFSKQAFEGPVQLADDEVLVHPRNLSIVFAEEIEKLGKGTDEQKAANEIITEINTKNNEGKDITSDLNELLDMLGFSGEKKISISKTIVADTIFKKKVKVVGIYHGIDLNRDADKKEFRFMMNDTLMLQFGIYNEQGEYDRILLRGEGTRQGREYLTDLMMSETGVKLNWFGNNSLTLISKNAPTIMQASDLFLYAALILAAFSIFMMFNYIATSIVNKRQSIGVLRGLGSGGKDIFVMFASESIVISIINSIFAVAVSALGCLFINMYIKNVMNIPVPFAIFGVRQAIIIVAMSILTSVLSSILPIMKIVKEKPVDLIRKE